MNGLNNKQQEAVQNIEGPTLILAGAGTGKTKTIVERISYILNKGEALTHQIMAVTFTNKAAREMQSRVLTATQQDLFWVGTFHSICAKILRKHAQLVGLNSSFTIIDRDDQLNLIKNIISDINPEYIDTQESKKKLRSILTVLQNWKNKALTPYNVPQAKNELERAALECYQLYQERLKISNSVDFDDLILHNINIFNNHPEVLEEYQNKIKYLMVDEYQDTNTVQYLFVRLIAQKYKNICCVGDDDQSIYSWRGAEVSNILRFTDDFPGATVIKLEQNYRSTPHILAVARAVIDQNQDRLGKTLWTESQSNTKVKLMLCQNHKDEARNIISKIAQDKDFKNTAILIRASAQSRPFEEYATYYGVNYHIIGGIRFYDRKEIKDALSYIKIAINNNDDVAFERIINTPKRGIGPLTLKKIYYAALSDNISLTTAASKLLTQKVIKSPRLELLLRQLHEWNNLSEKTNPSYLLDTILRESGYMELISQGQEIESSTRKENLRELLHSLQEFNDTNQFLEYVALVTTSDNNNNADGISIMTLHSAKGLEFDNVFLPGWEEGIFPHQRCIKEGNVEEERRLAYVGITRAKKTLCISLARGRFINNVWLNPPPSRFLQKIPKEHIVYI